MGFCFQAHDNFSSVDVFHTMEAIDKGAGLLALLNVVEGLPQPSFTILSSPSPALF